MTSEIKSDGESGERVRISASQIAGFEACQVAWAFRYIAGVKPPQTSAQEAGTRHHARVERYLGSGEHPGDDAEGRLIQAAMRPGILPPPIVGLRVEHEFSLPLGGGHEFIGFIDAVREPIDGRALVVDHKFVAALKWAKSESELRKDPQPASYARAAVEMFPGVREIEARWVYYQKGSTKVQAVSLVRSIEEIERAWRPIEAKARDLVRLRQAKVDPQSLVGNSESCGSYGGCPHRADCSHYQRTAGFGSSFRTAKGATEMSGSLLDKLKALKETQAGAQAAPAQAVPAKAEPAPVSALAKLQALKGATGANPPAKAEPAPVPAPTPIAEEKAAELAKPKRAKAPASQPASAKASALTVLFGCAVVKQPGDSALPVQLVELLAPLMRDVADAAEKAHWALIPYNEGKAMLAHAFDKWLADSAWKGSIYVDERSLESQAVREVLLAHADVVVRGVG